MRRGGWGVGVGGGTDCIRLYGCVGGGRRGVRWGVASLVFVFEGNESPDDGGMDVFSGGAAKGCEGENKRMARRGPSIIMDASGAQVEKVRCR